jgi:hypothetical protein
MAESGLNREFYRTRYRTILGLKWGVCASIWDSGVNACKHQIGTYLDEQLFANM